MGDSLQPGGDLLVRLTKKLDEFSDDVLVTPVEEGSRDTGVAGTSGTTNSVDIVVDVTRKIVVNDMGDVGNIKTTSSDGGGNHDRGATGSEGLESHLTLALSAVTMDGGRGKVVAHEEIAEHVGHALGLDEDKGEAQLAGRLTLRGEDIEEDTALVVILDVFDLLGDVLAGGADTADTEEDVILQKVLGKDLDVAGERGGKHEGLTLVDTRHVLALNNAADLGLETHIKHAIGLVKYEVLDVGEADTSTLNEVDKPTRSGAQEVTAPLD